MRERAAAVLAALHCGGQVVFGERDNDVDWLAVGWRRRQVERQADGGTLRASVNAQRQVRPLRRGLQELARRALVAAVELVMAIDDHLRRVDLGRRRRSSSTTPAGR